MQYFRNPSNCSAENDYNLKDTKRNSTIYLEYNNTKLSSKHIKFERIKNFGPVKLASKGILKISKRIVFCFLCGYE